MRRAEGGREMLVGRYGTPSLLNLQILSGFEMDLVEVVRDAGEDNKTNKC